MIGLAVATFGGVVQAQGMMGGDAVATDSSVATSSLTDVAKGGEVYNKLQAKQLTCADLKNDDFEVLGEYFMNQRLGASHYSMNTQMQTMMGKDGEEAMHSMLGKRLSGCDTSAGFMSAPLGGMVGGWQEGDTADGRYGMHSDRYGERHSEGAWHIVGLIFLLLVLVMLFKHVHRHKGLYGARSNSAMDILKERYARGEIDEKDFLDRKKNLL